MRLANLILSKWYRSILIDLDYFSEVGNIVAWLGLLKRRSRNWCYCNQNTSIFHRSFCFTAIHRPYEHLSEERGGEAWRRTNNTPLKLVLISTQSIWICRIWQTMKNRVRMEIAIGNKKNDEIQSYLMRAKLCFHLYQSLHHQKHLASY